MLARHNCSDGNCIRRQNIRAIRSPLAVNFPGKTASSAESVGSNRLESANMAPFAGFSVMYGPSPFSSWLFREDPGHCGRASEDGSARLAHSFGSITPAFSSRWNAGAMPPVIPMLVQSPTNSPSDPLILGKNQYPLDLANVRHCCLMGARGYVRQLSLLVFPVAMALLCFGFNSVKNCFTFS